MQNFTRTTPAQCQTAENTLEYHAQSVRRLLLKDPKPSTKRFLAADSITHENTPLFVPPQIERTMPRGTPNLYRLALAYYHGDGGRVNDKKAGWFMWHVISRSAAHGNVSPQGMLAFHAVMHDIANELIYQQNQELYGVLFNLKNASHGYCYSNTRETVDPNILARSLRPLATYERSESTDGT